MTSFYPRKSNFLMLVAGMVLDYINVKRKAPDFPKGMNDYK